MKQEHADLIAEAADMIGTEVEARSYSGRGMYGQDTAAVVGDVSNIIGCVAQAMADLVEEREACEANGRHERLDELVDPEDFVMDMMNLRMDAMGFQAVLY